VSTFVFANRRKRGEKQANQATKTKKKQKETRKNEKKIKNKRKKARRRRIPTTVAECIYSRTMSVQATKQAENTTLITHDERRRRAARCPKFGHSCE